VKDDSKQKKDRPPPDGLGLGLNIVVAAFVFGFLGNWVGKRIGAEDALTLLGGFIGAAAGFYSLYIHMVVRPRDDRDEK
jgi:positive regulator of sigma E activity